MALLLNAANANPPFRARTRPKTAACAKALPFQGSESAQSFNLISLRTIAVRPAEEHRVKRRFRFC
jgi:hypothetical protein